LPLTDWALRSRIPVCAQLTHVARATILNVPDESATGSDSLVIRYPLWIRLYFWAFLFAGAVTALAGTVVMILEVPTWSYTSLITVLAGILLVVIGWLGVRSRITCSPDGVDLRAFHRTRCVETTSIQALAVRPAPGALGLAWAVISVIGWDDSQLRLQPTLLVGRDQEQLELRLYALIKAMYAAIGLTLMLEVDLVGGLSPAEPVAADREGQVRGPS
jgi:hypothetical protein